MMTTPLDEKAVAAAHEAYAKTTGGMLDGQPMENAIRAYLSTAPAPDGLEVLGYLNWSEVHQRRYYDETPRGTRNTWPLVRLSQAQSALAAVRDANKALMNERTNLVATKREQLAALIARAETAEAEVKRLTEENEALRGAIATPEAVHANMLRGGIPKLSIRQALHLHGAEALEKWDGIEAAEARIKALEERLNEIRELNMTAKDENGQRWANSDLIDQTIMLALATLNSREKVNG